jgi:hypothetical protein
MLRIGQKLQSYCNGYFGRDFYGGRIEAVGFDWVVARTNNDNIPRIAYFPEGIDNYAHLISDWNEYETAAENGES